MILWRPTRPFRTNTQKRCPFHNRGLACKSRKSRNTWSNRQIWPWNMEWNRAKTNRVLPREHTGHSKHPLPTTQEKTLHMDITRWSTLKSSWLCSLEGLKLKCQSFGHLISKSQLTGKDPKCLEIMRTGGEGNDRGLDGWMASPPQCIGVWANSGR